jgi:putative hydrolase of the HAD superfamily
MIKAILFDADGVVIAGRHKYFSDRLSEEHSIPVEKIMPFFKNEFGLCSVGQADLKEVLPIYLEEWKWKGSIDEFLHYWFAGENELDIQVLNEVDSQREAGIACYLATDQEKYRAAYLMNALDLGDHFDGAFFSCDLGFKKSQSEFFQSIINKLKVNPEEILYWDDDQKNVDVASSLGIQGKFYTKGAFNSIN